MNVTMLRKISGYGERYCQEYVYGASDPVAIARNWRSAFLFFMGKACMQGRRDTVSEKVRERVEMVILEKFPDDKDPKPLLDQRAREWRPVRLRLEREIGPGKYGKMRDIEMVVSALDYCARLPDCNIVNQSLKEIRAGRIVQHSNAIQASAKGNVGGIVQVGPKIAAFYLRDLVTLYQLEDFVAPSDAFSLQAVDTWVAKIAARLGIRAKSSEGIQLALADGCRRARVSGIRFNQGAWYVGANSFQLLLEKLDV